MVQINIPADVPQNMHAEYLKNYEAITRGTGRLFLFAADHKMEHLDSDFFVPYIDPAIHKPEHLFEIASKGRIGVMATQLGLIARYAPKYSNINFVAKLNSKSNLIPTKDKDPISRQLWTVNDVLQVKKSGIKISGIGLTIYLGSEFENIMLEQAAQTVFQAHQEGLIAILWIYPRGKNVKNERDNSVIAGAAGIGNCLGADFVKINPPTATDTNSATLLKRAVEAAGNTKVICAGGISHAPATLLKDVYNQIHIAGTSGAAIGRNIYQHSLDEAIAITEALAAIIYDNSNPESVLNIIKNK